jgi:hypothetical protein
VSKHDNTVRCDWKGCDAWAEHGMGSALGGYRNVAMGNGGHEYDLCGFHFRALRANLLGDGREIGRWRVREGGG